MDSFNILIIGSIFIILLVIIYQTVKQSQFFDTTKSVILSICVSVLATIGLNSHFKDSIRVLLILYAAMAIAILAVLLITFIGKYLQRANGRLSDNIIDEDDDAKTDDKRLKRRQDDHRG